MGIKRAAHCLLLLTSFCLTTFGPTASFAQQAPSPKKHVEVPTIAADPKDVSTIDGMVRAFYDVISGPAGQPRQWSRDRSLYWPETRFFSVGEDRTGKERIGVMTHQEFVDRSNDAVVKSGFYEQEIHRVTQRFGNIAHVFSTYESREKADGPIVERGINSIELVFDGTRWWITSANWQDETKSMPIPSEFLPNNSKPPHGE